MKEFDLYHTQETRQPLLTFPIMAEGSSQWLGDGYYFWEELSLAKWWGKTKKCDVTNTSRSYSIFKSKVKLQNDDDFLDTVFDEVDYRNFVRIIEDFAKRYTDKTGQKPSLDEFNDFIQDFNIWQDIKLIRFQDVPKKDEFVSVSGFYYKKRIQFKVNDPEIITNFVHLNNYACV